MKNKLESLKSSKFEAFKGLEVVNPLLVTGGQKQGTTWEEYTDGKLTRSGNDMWYTGRDAQETAYNPTSTHWNEKGDMTGQDSPIPPPSDDPAVEMSFELTGEVFE